MHDRIRETAQTVSVCLGIKKTLERKPMSASSQLPAPSSQLPAPSSQRVLLVEDDKASQVFEEKVLAHLGLEVDLARNGADVSSERISTIIVDKFEGCY
jgi:hypothetical protein